MGIIRKPLPVKLFTGFLSSDPVLFSECTALLTERFGPVDMESEAVPWVISDYYRDEMGSSLFRKFVFFSQLRDPDILPAVKAFSVTVEGRFSKQENGGMRRRINIDPGYVTEAKVVLATTKDFSHRIYIGGSFYAEVTLRFSSREHTFSAVDHTYYDFRSADYIRLFNDARTVLRKGLDRG